MPYGTILISPFFSCYVLKLFEYLFGSSIPDGSVDLGWILGTISDKKADRHPQKGFHHRVYSLRCHFRQCSYNGYFNQHKFVVNCVKIMSFNNTKIAGVIGIEKSIKMINNHEFMGFLDFCSSQ